MLGKELSLKQEDYLYGVEWDVNVVSLFIEVLADQARMGKFNPKGNNRHAISTAQYFVNKFFNKNLELKDCVKQVRLLRQRHSTFSTMMMRDDVGWSIEENSIDCNTETWDEIVRANPFAVAYAKCGDPHWDDLKVIFGDPGVLSPPMPCPTAVPCVITISDDVPSVNLSPNFTPLDEVIDISSDKSGTISTDFWNELGPVGNSSDDDDSFRSPSLKTEMSSSNPPKRVVGKGNYIVDEMCVNLYGPSYVSSSVPTTPNSKK